MKYFAQIHSCSGELYWYRNFINEIISIIPFIEDKQTLEKYDIQKHNMIIDEIGYVVHVDKFNDSQQNKIERYPFYDNVTRFGIELIDCYIYTEPELRLKKLNKLLNK